MNAKRKIEVFTAGCSICDEAVELVKSIACPSCDVQVLDMNEPKVAAKAKKYGIKNVPSVVIDGKLAGCCANQGVSEKELRAAALGKPVDGLKSCC
jgi:glutaredoxin 3